MQRQVDASKTLQAINLAMKSDKNLQKFAKSIIKNISKGQKEFYKKI